MYDDAKDSYDLRSKVVHGQAYDPADVEDSANMIHEYLRQALLKCLESNSQPDLPALDTQMMFSPRIG